MDRDLAHSGLARVLVNEGKLAEARHVLEKSVAELRTEVGFGRPPQEWLWVMLCQLADVCEKLGDRLAADRATAEANRLGEQMRMNSPFGSGGGFRGPKKDGLLKKKRSDSDRDPG